MPKVKVALALPWYAGADRDCVVHFLQFQHYLGRLQERLLRGKDADLPKLDPANTTGFSEIPDELWGTEFEFGISDEIGCSLPGMARERCVDNALKWGADFILFYDSDMIFGTDLFLRLFMAKKPVVAALAFTGRQPVTPVIYQLKDFKFTHEVSFNSEPIHDYPRDTLFQVDAVGGGVFLVDANVFRSMSKPWFATQSALGEDIYFCARCKMQDIPVWVHTGAKTIHKPTFPQVWHDEELYLQQNPHLHSPKMEALAKEVSDLCTYVVGTGATIYEGSSTMPELSYLFEKSSSLPRQARICEVGMNTGMSTMALLLGSPTATVTSYDIGEWSCVRPAKDYLDRKFPGRHTLVLGDTKKTLWTPEPMGLWDLTFIDGGHDFETAWADICSLCTISRHLIIDDIQMPGVKKAYDQAIEKQMICPISEHGDSDVIGSERRWAYVKGFAK